MPKREIAFGVLVAGIENLALPCAFFHTLALAAGRTGYACGNGSGIVAVGIAHAGNKAAARARLLDHQVLAALRADPDFFIFRRLAVHGLDLAIGIADKIAGIAAFRVAGAGQESPGFGKAGAFQT